jgi:hypothetical protein
MNEPLWADLVLAPASFAFAALFFFRPYWADRLYRGLWFRVTPGRGRILGCIALVSAAYYTIMLILRPFNAVFG